MHPIVLLEKLHPDGSPRRIGRGYRLDDVAGFARVYVPAGSRFWHANGVWRTESPWISAFRPGSRFVPHRSFPPGDDGFYVDIVREVRVDGAHAVFVDLFLDVLAIDGRVWEKDHEKLGQLADDEAAAAVAVAREVRERLERAAGVFARTHAVWERPHDAAALEPLDALEL